MKLEWQILIALGIDLILGDPKNFPHPVQWIGALASGLEEWTRKIIKDQYLAGSITVIFTLVITILTVVITIDGFSRIHPLFGDVISILILYTTFAVNDLRNHAFEVYTALDKGTLQEAREKLSKMVGRDTASLNEEEISRACVESVAENTVDGITAPLFFAFLAGPVGAMVYKAINTMDSMFGYKNSRYLLFGSVPARLDDLFNYLPARITAPLTALSAAILRMNPKKSLKIMWRDGRKHASPNAGLNEAAVAGALGVQLGGDNFYKGKLSKSPLIGDPEKALKKEHILSATRLMLYTSEIFFILFFVLRVVFSS
jgi:adenosylcobinamide-phosphate synthase